MRDKTEQDFSSPPQVVMEDFEYMEEHSSYWHGKNTKVMKIFRRKLPRKKKKKKKEAPCEVMAGLFEDVSLPLSFRVVHPTAKNKMKQVPGPEK